MNYHNSYIIADPNEAFILETAGEWWIAENVINFRSISNDVTIRGKGDLRRKGIIQHAIDMNYCKDDDEFDFAITYAASNRMPRYVEYSMNRLKENVGKITPLMMMEFLREHEGNICRHRRNDFTASSQVSQLNKDKNHVDWFTGSALTCLSVFKPYFFPLSGKGILDFKPNDKINEDWFWIRHFNHVKSFIKNPLNENLERNDYKESITNIEQNLIRRISKISSNESNLTNEQLLDEFNSINKIAWKKTEELLEEK